MDAVRDMARECRAVYVRPRSHIYTILGEVGNDMSGMVIVVALLLAQLIFIIVTYERELRKTKERLGIEIHKNMELKEDLWVLEREKRDSL